MPSSLLSPCCGKPVRVKAEFMDDRMRGDMHWYECSACGKPCDPVHRDEPSKCCVVSSTEYTRDEIVDALRPHREEIVQADEWRPLADHVLALLAQARLSKDAKDEVHPSDAHVAEVQKSRDEWER